MSFLPFLRHFFSREFFGTLLAWILLIGLFLLLRPFLGLFLITFIFSYIFYRLSHTLARFFLRNSPKKGKSLLIEKYLNYIVSILYVIFVVLIIFLIIKIVPIIIKEIGDLIRHAPMLVANINDMTVKTEQTFNIDLGLNTYLGDKVNTENIEQIGGIILKNLRDISGIVIQILIGLLLSFIFILERKSIIRFFDTFRDGSFGFLYHEFANIGQKFANSFGLVMEAQAIIAFVNAILTSIGLMLISYIHGGQPFPYILTLSSIVFIFGFIPVLGTFISAFPILVIGYGYGAVTGDQYMIILACIAIITVIHAVEAYYLNPRIVSSYMHFPVFVTFLTLIIAEHFFGPIGLIIGVPLFAIFLSLMKDFDGYVQKVKQEVKNLSTEKCPTE